MTCTFGDTCAYFHFGCILYSWNKRLLLFHQNKVPFLEPWLARGRGPFCKWPNWPGGGGGCGGGDSPAINFDLCPGRQTADWGLFHASRGCKSVLNV